MANAKHVLQILGSVHDESQWKQVIEALNDCRFFAYIYHDHDVDDMGVPKSKHLHFIAEDRHTLKNWAERFGLPENMLEFCHSMRGSIRYLIHLDDKDKFQYNFEDIVTNRPIRLKSYFEDNQELSPSRLFIDLKRTQKGEISCKDFLEKYQYFLSKQSFYCQFRIYQELLKYEQH